VLATTIIGSGMAMLDGTIVHVPAPGICADLHAFGRRLQWIVDGYLLSWRAWFLVAGSLVPVYGRAGST